MLMKYLQLKMVKIPTRKTSEWVYICFNLFSSVFMLMFFNTFIVFGYPSFSSFSSNSVQNCTSYYVSIETWRIFLVINRLSNILLRVLSSSCPEWFWSSWGCSMFYDYFNSSSFRPSSNLAYIFVCSDFNLISLLRWLTVSVGSPNSWFLLIMTYCRQCEEIPYIHDFPKSFAVTFILLEVAASEVASTLFDLFVLLFWIRCQEVSFPNVSVLVREPCWFYEFFFFPF